MKKLILAFSFVVFLVGSIAPQAEACPKRFRLIKAVGRATKTGIIKVVGGLCSFKDKISAELQN